MAEVRIYVLGVNMLFWGANATLFPPSTILYRGMVYCTKVSHMS